jgi:fatty acid amide hydrolase
VKHGATLEVGLAGSYSCLYNLLGWPAGVVPVTRVRQEEETATPRGRDVCDQTARETEKGSAGLPIAVQIAARPWREDIVLGVMAALEQ